ncbi:MAG: hypothetical protein ACOZQL_05980, partial [Myxococcota bacterium]
RWDATSRGTTSRSGATASNRTTAAKCLGTRPDNDEVARPRRLTAPHNASSRVVAHAALTVGCDVEGHDLAERCDSQQPNNGGEVHRRRPGPTTTISHDLDVSLRRTMRAHVVAHAALTALTLGCDVEAHDLAERCDSQQPNDGGEAHRADNDDFARPRRLTASHNGSSCVVAHAALTALTLGCDVEGHDLAERTERRRRSASAPTTTISHDLVVSLRRTMRAHASSRTPHSRWDATSRRARARGASNRTTAAKWIGAGQARPRRGRTTSSSHCAARWELTRRRAGSTLH